MSHPVKKNDASPPSTTYRLGKFIRRNRPAVLAGVLVAAALVIGAELVVSGRQDEFDQAVDIGGAVDAQI